VNLAIGNIRIIERAVESRKKELTDRLDKVQKWAIDAGENGLFKTQHAISEESIFQMLLAARVELESFYPDFPRCENYISRAERRFNAALNEAKTGWRFFNVYAFDIWIILIGCLIGTFFVYSLFIHCNPATNICEISPPTPDKLFTTTNSRVDSNNNSISNNDNSEIGLGLGLRNTIGENGPGISLQNEQMRLDTPSLQLPQNGVYAALWGAVGGILRGLYALYKNLSNRQHLRPWIISYISAPFIGAILGACYYIYELFASRI
jgi:hypothetical protein